MRDPHQHQAPPAVALLCAGLLEVQHRSNLDTAPGCKEGAPREAVTTLEGYDMTMLRYNGRKSCIQPALQAWHSEGNTLTT